MNASLFSQIPVYHLEISKVNIKHDIIRPTRSKLILIREFNGHIQDFHNLKKIFLSMLRDFRDLSDILYPFRIRKICCNLSKL